MKPKIKNEKELLDLFVCKNDYPQKLTRPFENLYYEGKVWASEGHLLLVIDKECLSEEYEKDKLHLPEIKERNINTVVTKKAIQEAFSKCEQVEEEVTIGKNADCEECDGSGYVDWEYTTRGGKVYYEEDECPVCKGSGYSEEAISKKTGKKIADPDAPMKIDTMGVFSRYVQIVLKTMDLLEVDEIRHVFTSDKEPNLYLIADGIKLYWMPALVDLCDNEEFVTIETIEL